MDIGHGTGSFAYETAEALMAAGRLPDVISTDLHQLEHQRPRLRPADLHEQVPPPRHVARRTSFARPRPVRRSSSVSSVSSARCGPGRSRTSRSSACCRDGSRSTTSGARCARRGALLVNTQTIVGGRPFEPLPAAAPGAVGGGPDLAGARRSRSPSASRRSATAGTRRPRAARPRRSSTRTDRPTGRGRVPRPASGRRRARPRRRSRRSRG